MGNILWNFLKKYPYSKGLKVYGIHIDSELPGVYLFLIAGTNLFVMVELAHCLAAI